MVEILGPFLAIIAPQDAEAVAVPHPRVVLLHSTVGKRAVGRLHGARAVAGTPLLLLPLSRTGHLIRAESNLPALIALEANQHLVMPPALHLLHLLRDKILKHEFQLLSDPNWHYQALTGLN